MTLLYRCAVATGRIPEYFGAFSGVADVPAASDYAVDAVRWAIGTGILKGDGAQQLDLLSPLTRAQAAAVVRRYLQQQESLPAA